VARLHGRGGRRGGGPGGWLAVGARGVSAPLSIALVAPEFLPDLGGVETYSYELARELSRRGHRVTVFTRRHPAGEVAGESFTVRPELSLRRYLDGPLLHREHFDVVHATNAAYAWLALESAPVVVSVHGNDFLRPYCRVGRRDLQRWSGPWNGLRRRLAGLDRALGERRTEAWMAAGLARCRRVVTNSLYTESVLLARLPSCAGRTTAALVGLSPELMALPEPSPRGGSPRLITVARLSEPRKCVDRVIAGLARLKDRFDFTYEVVGDGPLRPALVAQVKASGLAERVTFSGQLERATLIDHLRASDLFILTSDVLPTSHEGFGIVYLEANACGVGVLACRAGGAVEAVAEGVSGFFVDAPTPAAIGGAVEQFLAGAVRFDPHACQTFARGFDWARVVDRIEPFYIG